MRLKEIEDRNGYKFTVNLDAFSCITKEDCVWNFCFGGICLLMDEEEGKKLLDEIMKLYVCKAEPNPDPKPAYEFSPAPHQIMVDNNVLDKNHVRYSILSADFLDAEDKLELLVRLGV